MAKFLYSGSGIEYSPVADTPAGTLIICGDLAAVNNHMIKAGTTGFISIEGVYAVEKDEKAVSVGAKVYWDVTNAVATATEGENTFIGHAVAAAAATDECVMVKLNA